MFALAHFAAPQSADASPTVVDACIQRVLAARVHGPESRQAPAATLPKQETSINEVRVTGRVEDRCRRIMEGCGHCHAPAVGNCNFTVQTESMEFSRANVASADSSAIVLATGAGVDAPALRSEPIPYQAIRRVVWLDGDDAPESWWNFDQLIAPGETAQKMLAIATEHNVACANCHVAHGDFRLTQEGEVFRDSGRVIARVPLRALTDRPATTSP